MPNVLPVYRVKREAEVEAFVGARETLSGASASVMPSKYAKGLLRFFCRSSTMRAVCAASWPLHSASISEVDLKVSVKAGSTTSCNSSDLDFSATCIH